MWFIAWILTQGLWHYQKTDVSLGGGLSQGRARGEGIMLMSSPLVARWEKVFFFNSVFSLFRFYSCIDSNDHSFFKNYPNSMCFTLMESLETTLSGSVNNSKCLGDGLWLVSPRLVTYRLHPLLDTNNGGSFSCALSFMSKTGLPPVGRPCRLQVWI